MTAGCTSRAFSPEQVADARVLLAHGSDGALHRELFDMVIAPALGPVGPSGNGCAVEETQARALAFATDGYVVRPPFFPGGDIGRLAVSGTVNGLATRGARPASVALGLVLEEGLPLRDLSRLLRSASAAAQEAGVRIAAIDTRVVERGAADRVFVQASGVGWVDGEPLNARRIRPGDVVLVTGTLGDHGIAVLGERDGLRLGCQVESDVAPVASLVLGLRLAGVELHAAHDLAGGGLAAALHDLCAVADQTVVLEEDALPVRPAVREACDLLGLDPWMVANEGNMALVLPAAQADAAVQWLHAQARGAHAARVGTVVASRRQRVLSRNAAGGERIVPMPRGGRFPRIC